MWNGQIPLFFIMQVLMPRHCTQAGSDEMWGLCIINWETSYSVTGGYQPPGWSATVEANDESSTYPYWNRENVVR